MTELNPNRLFRNPFYPFKIAIFFILDLTTITKRPYVPTKTPYQGNESGFEDVIIRFSLLVIPKFFL